MAENLAHPNIAILAAALDDDPRRAAQLARSLGFTGILFDAYSTSLNIPDLSATGRREFRHVLTSHQQQPVGLRCDLGPKGLGPGADVDRVISQLDRAMEAAAGLQAPLLCVDLGPLPKVKAIAKPKPRVSSQLAGLIIVPESVKTAPEPEPEAESAPTKVDIAFESQIAGALSDLGHRADRYGATIAFRSDLASFASLEAALHRVSCSWFGVDLDPVAMLRDEWSSDEIFSTLGPLIRHVRGRDAVKGADRRTKPAVIGKGDVNWRELIANLDATGYHGWITIDPVELSDRLGAASNGLKSLREIG